MKNGYKTDELAEFKTKRQHLDLLIETVEKTLVAIKKEVDMSNVDKFEGLKHDLVEKNEQRFGREVRERYGNEAVDASNRRMLGLSEQDYETWQKLDAEIRAALEAAVAASEDPAGAEGARICNLHRQWLSYTWPNYTTEAHHGLAEMYVADERFRSYYDKVVAGCAQWLRDAIVKHAR